MQKTVTYLFIFLFLISCQTKRPFNSKEWKNWQESEAEPSLRREMLDDLLTNYQLKSLNRAEILTMLGKPSKEGKNFIQYYLGYAGRGIDTARLLLNLDNGQVVSIEVFEG